MTFVIQLSIKPSLLFFFYKPIASEGGRDNISLSELNLICLFFKQHRKAVVITSRVHPGETNASWMMKGFIDYLLSNSTDAKVSNNFSSPSVEKD